jgi:hypothetical protein
MVVPEMFILVFCLSSASYGNRLEIDLSAFA